MPRRSTPQQREAVAHAKEAIAAGDRPRALLVLHALATRGAEAATALTPEVIDALVATASLQREEADRAAIEALADVRRARGEIERLIRQTPLDREDLRALRALLDAKEREARTEERTREAKAQGGTVGSPGVRAGRGYLELKLIPRANGRLDGPYLYYRLKDGRHLRSRYLGKPPA